jgi:glucose-6-phosphate 1-dehydrogenase
MRQHGPTQIIILGGAGDLAQRKLLPALFDLYRQDLLPEIFQIIGLARTQRTTDEYQSLVRDALLKQSKNYEPSLISTFSERVAYVTGSFDEGSSYDLIREKITLLETQCDQKTNRLFYLAVPPTHYADIFRSLHASGLTQTDHPHWSRILVEKPFGNDYDSAVVLDRSLSALFAEDQIFRIDHYLAKEAIQNILSFRFANTLLRSTWNNEHIKSVHINMLESINASNRGAFYDKVGALRDVGQNHLLQILALIAMDEPEAFTADHIRKERSSILEKLQPLSPEEIKTDVVRAQYDDYIATPGVAADSQTETYFEFRAFLDHPRWRGVPFYVRGGKALKNDEVYVEIEFKEVEKGPFTTKGNSIILTISPVQSMNLTLNVKKPGHGYHIEENTLSFAWDEDNRGIVNAYEKVLLDCIEGDQTLFTKTSEVLASWKFISSITDTWGTVPLQQYQQGSQGPLHSICRDLSLQ